MTLTQGWEDVFLNDVYHVLEHIPFEKATWCEGKMAEHKAGVSILSITKTRLFKNTENFTNKKMKIFR